MVRKDGQTALNVYNVSGATFIDVPGTLETTSMPNIAWRPAPDLRLLVYTQTNGLMVSMTGGRGARATRGAECGGDAGGRPEGSGLFVPPPPPLRDREYGGPPHWGPTDGGRAITDGGWRVTDGGWRVTDGGYPPTAVGWRGTNGCWRVTDGGWRVTDGGWRTADRGLVITAGGWVATDGR